MHTADPSRVFTTFMNLLVKAVSVFFNSIRVYFPGICVDNEDKNQNPFFPACLMVD